MAEQPWAGTPSRVGLRRAARVALRATQPELRIVAEDFLGEASRIDLLAVGPEGELVAIRIAQEEDPLSEALALVRALADLSWLRPRIGDLCRLAPELELEFEAEPRAIVLVPHAGRELRSAAENLPTRLLAVWSYRCLRQQGQPTLQIEPIATDDGDAIARAPRPAAAEADPRPAHGPRHASVGPRLTDPPSPSVFRTGLRDEDLRATPLPERTDRGPVRADGVS